MDIYEFVMQHQWWALAREDGDLLQVSPGGPVWDSPLVHCHPMMAPMDTRSLAALKFPTEAIAQATADNLNNRAAGDGLMVYLDPEHQILCQLLFPCVNVGDEPCHVVKQEE